MVGIGRIVVLDGKVDNEKGEVSAMDVMFEQARSSGGVITVGKKKFTELLVGETTGMREAVDAVDDADHGAVAVPNCVGSIAVTSSGSWSRVSLMYSIR
jgi:hypothetical protein